MNLTNTHVPSAVGKATRPIAIFPVVESQRTERHQATDPTIFGPVNPPLAWRRAFPLFAFFAVLCLGMFAPPPVQFGIAAGAVAVAFAVLGRVLR